MQRAISIAAVLAVVAAGAAFGYASDPSYVTWSDSFEGQTVGARADQMTGWGGGGLHNWKVADYNGNKVVEKQGAGPGDPWGWNFACSAPPAIGLSSYDVQQAHFMARPSYGNGTDVGNTVSVTTLFGDNFFSFAFSARSWQARIYYEALGWFRFDSYSPVTAWGDSNWHDFDIVYTRGIGKLQWFVDGAEVGSVTDTRYRFKDIERFEFDSSSTQTDRIMWDDFKAGTVPEPSGLLSLATCALGWLGVIRRRRVS